MTALQYKKVEEFLKVGQIEEGVAYFANLISRFPFELGLYNNLGICYFKLGNLKNAAQIYEKSLNIKPNYFIALNNLGIIYYELKDYEKSVKYYRKALKIDPNNFNIYNNLGNALVKIKKFKEAFECYEFSLKLSPNNYVTYNLLGLAHHEAKDVEKAFELYDKSIELEPRAVGTYNNMGFSYIEQADFEQAILPLSKAVQLNPHFVEAYNNLGFAYYATHELEKSMKCYETAIRLNPHFAQLYFNLSLTFLILGNFEKGWELYEQRLLRNDSENICSIKINKPKWNGSSLEGKTIYVYCEQGFGDTIMFARYLPILSKMAAKVIFKPQKQLTKLFKNNDFGVEIVEEAMPEEKISFDEHIPLLSLPYVLKTRLDNIPCPKKYLKADAQKVQFYKEKYFNNDNLKVGIFWHGSQKIMRQRSMDLCNFFELAQIPNIKLYSIQVGSAVKELQNVPPSIDITDLGATFVDFDDTAAAVENLDVVVSIDSCVVHLAGAMNKPVFVLLPSASDWRWLLDRADSPWYKSVKLLRQKRPKNWTEVFQKAVEELSKF